MDAAGGKAKRALKALTEAEVLNEPGLRQKMCSVLQEAGFRNRKQLKVIGLHFPRRSWVAAKNGKKSLGQRGRPSLLQNPDLQELVRKAAVDHSRTSSKFIMVQNSEGEKEAVMVRHWTTLPYNVYVNSKEIMKRMSFSTFQRMLVKHFPFIRHGPRVSDYCDHCHTFQKVVVPCLVLEFVQPFFGTLFSSERVHLS